MRRELKEVEEIEEVGERNAVAAFFDLDGTLLPLPSLERRFWRTLRYRNKIGFGNYLAWLREAARLLPHGLSHLANSNKAYLRGISASEVDALHISPFFPEAVRQIAWHAERGHHLVIVSGTLEPLALGAVRVLAEQMASQSVPVSVDIRATKLELAAGSWTGRIVGDAMFGEAKARAIRKFCVSRGIQLAESFAYGDSAKDRWMLESVGRPIAVNPSDDLARIARRNGWPILCWAETAVSTPTPQNSPTVLRAQLSSDDVRVTALPERECWR